MWEFKYTETIEAPPETVYAYITNTGEYPQWNPFIVSAEGPIALDGVISGDSQLGRFKVGYRHKIYGLEPNRRLCWRDFGFSSLFACGDRCRELTPQGNATRYECKLRISGPLAWLVDRLFGKGLRDGIVAEARAIKTLAEAQTGTQAS